MLITSMREPASISEQSVTDNKIRMWRWGVVHSILHKKNLKTALAKEVNHWFALGKQMWISKEQSYTILPAYIWVEKWILQLG